MPKETMLTLVDLHGDPEAVYVLEELDAGASADAINSLLHGYILFACYRPIVDNHRFKLVIDAALRIGMSGRVMGDYSLTCRLSALSIRRRLTADEIAQYGHEIEALVHVEYITSQDPDKDRPVAIMRDEARITCANVTGGQDVLESPPNGGEIQ